MIVTLPCQQPDPEQHINGTSQDLLIFRVPQQPPEHLELERVVIPAP